MVLGGVLWIDLMPPRAARAGSFSGGVRPPRGHGGWMEQEKEAEDFCIHSPKTIKGLTECQIHRFISIFALPKSRTNCVSFGIGVSTEMALEL